MVKRIDVRFYLIEFLYKETEPCNFFKRKKGCEFDFNYLEDSGCRMFMDDIGEYYYVEYLYNYNKNSLSVWALEQHYDSLISISNECSEECDRMNILVNLKPDRIFYLNNTTRTDKVFCLKRLLFSKIKYSKEECELWSNLGLKIFGTLNNIIMNLDRSLMITIIDKHKYEIQKFKLKINNAQTERFIRSILRKVESNEITFILEAIMLYKEKKEKISIRNESNK